MKTLSPRLQRAALVLAVLSTVAMGACARRPPRPGPPVTPLSVPGEQALPPVHGVNPDIPTTPGARSSVVRYGPWTVPAATEANGGGGMIKNNVAIGVQRPCGDCFVTSIRPTLKHPDGRVANTDTGLWMHHIVLATMGRADPTCAGTYVGLQGERFFASGNERTRLRLPPGLGLRVGALDPWLLVYDLMNTNPTPEPVVLEVSYEWVPASTPGMRAVKPVWLDVNQCGSSEVPARTGAYHYSYSWTVNVPGHLIGIGGHLHDGGTTLIARNNTTGAVLCTLEAGYGGPGYEVAGGGGHAGHGAAPGGVHTYLSSMSQCVAQSAARPVATLAAGQQVFLEARYDSGAHPQHGTHPVMGIAIAYVLP